MSASPQNLLSTDGEHLRCFNRAGACAAQGDVEEALRWYDRALALKPDFAEGYNNRGLLHAGAGRHHEAIASFTRALQIRPGYERALNNLGLSCGALGERARALSCFDEALRLQPKYFSALANRAAVRLGLGQQALALEDYESALALRPDHADLQYRRGSLQQQLGSHVAAIDSFIAAISRQAGHVDALMACSASLAALRRFQEAMGCLDEVLKIDPRHVPALSNWGAVLADQGAWEQAVEMYERALAIDPGAYAVLCNRGIAAITLNHAQLAIDSFRRAGELAAARGFPAAEIAAVRTRLLDAMAAACDWNDYAALRDAAIAALGEGLALSPFVAITFSDDPALQLNVARQYAQRQYPAAEPGLAADRRYTHDRIRVAYVSADFHDHATAYLMAGLLEQHDPSRFEITVASFGPDDPNSHWQRRIRAAAGRFIEAAAMSDAQIAALLAVLEIDIAVDLKGYTLGCRTGIFARRPAPVQVNYLGFPGSMGVPYMDYILADRELIPDGAEAHYEEKVARLPECYQINDDRRAWTGTPPSRQSHGLPDEAMVFCSFNASYKITPELFGVWMRILTRSPGSVLWQLQKDPVVRENLRREAARHGVDPERLVFAAQLPVTEHLARIACADLLLDTLPVNAHTTASDALWAGVPILTQRGRSFAARVCSSLLNAVGLTELVVDSTTAYEELAVALASDRSGLTEMRARAAAARTQSPLFDTVRTTRHIEAAYHEMWQRHQAGHPPDHFDVPPLPS